MGLLSSKAKVRPLQTLGRPERTQSLVDYRKSKNVKYLHLLISRFHEAKRKINWKHTYNFCDASGGMG